MDFEKADTVSFDEYLNMIELKTSVLLAASLQMGAYIGGASAHNCNLLYQFGKNLGIAFQVQDDYLDAFGDPEKFGKDVGGDIRQNKKTFLLLHAMEIATPEQKEEITYLLQNDPADKVGRMLRIYLDCNVDQWAQQLKAEIYRYRHSKPRRYCRRFAQEKAIKRSLRLSHQPGFLANS